MCVRARACFAPQTITLVTLYTLTLSFLLTLDGNLKFMVQSLINSIVYGDKM